MAGTVTPNGAVWVWVSTIPPGAPPSDPDWWIDDGMGATELGVIGTYDDADECFATFDCTTCGPIGTGEMDVTGVGDPPEPVTGCAAATLTWEAAPDQCTWIAKSPGFFGGWIAENLICENGKWGFQLYCSFAGISASYTKAPPSPQGLYTRVAGSTDMPGSIVIGVEPDAGYRSLYLRFSTVGLTTSEFSILFVAKSSGETGAYYVWNFNTLAWDEISIGSDLVGDFYVVYSTSLLDVSDYVSDDICYMLLTGVGTLLCVDYASISAKLKNSIAHKTQQVNACDIITTKMVGDCLIIDTTTCW